MNQKTGLMLLLAILVVVAVSGCLTAEKVYCTSEDRQVEACYTLYDPVCGYSSPLTFKTYANDCVACVDQSVEYYTMGKCLVN